MPMYNYDCTSCGIIFEELVSIDYYKEPQEHDDCGNLCERTAEGQGIYAHGIGLTSGRGDGDKAKMDHRWMEDEIENTKAAVEGKSGISPYTNYIINHDEAVKQGKAKKVSPEKAKIRRESSKKLTQKTASSMSKEHKERLEGGHNVKDT